MTNLSCTLSHLSTRFSSAAAWLVGLAERAKRRLAGSSWTPLVVRGLVSLLALAGLGYIGSRASSHVQPSGDMSLAAGQVLVPSAEAARPEPQSVPQELEHKAREGAKRRSPAVTEDGRVILNLATEADLRQLPRVGAKRAAAIIKLRERLGKFRRVQDLLRVRGIGVRSLKQLEPLVVVDPPPPPPPQPPVKK